MSFGSLLLFFSIGFFLYCAFGQHKSEAHKETLKQDHTPKPSKCPPHQWDYEMDYQNQEIMICKACRRRPGYQPRE